MDGKLIPIAVITLVAALALASCTNGKTYTLEYDCDKSLYQGAKDSYSAGEKVTLVYKQVATDTDYAFYLDDEPLQFSGSEKGLTLTFTMPDHNAKLTHTAHNSMSIMSPVQAQPQTQILAYEDAVVATADGDRYTRLELFTTTDPQKAWLDKYDHGYNEAENTHTSYILPATAIEECKAALVEGDFANWKNMEPLPTPDGTTKYLSFLHDDETLVVTSSDIPEGHEGALGEIPRIIWSYSDRFEEITRP